MPAASQENAPRYGRGASGAVQDEETGLYYFGARYYDPRTSVFQSADPIIGKYLPSRGRERDENLPGLGGIYRSVNVNLYRYAAQNPLRYVDPDGRHDHIYTFYTGKTNLTGRQVFEAQTQGQQFLRNWPFGTPTLIRGNADRVTIGNEYMLPGVTSGNPVRVVDVHVDESGGFYKLETLPGHVFAGTATHIIQVKDGQAMYQVVGQGPREEVRAAINDTVAAGLWTRKNRNIRQNIIDRDKNPLDRLTDWITDHPRPIFGREAPLRDDIDRRKNEPPPSE